MKLDEVLPEITPLPWRFMEADNDKVIPTVRILGRRKHDPSKEICLGRLDTARDARYACHAANVLPGTVNALRLLLEDQKRGEIQTFQGAICILRIGSRRSGNHSTGVKPMDTKALPMAKFRLGNIVSTPNALSQSVPRRHPPWHSTASGRRSG